jgi:hypothetical protein
MQSIDHKKPLVWWAQDVVFTCSFLACQMFGIVGLEIEIE